MNWNDPEKTPPPAETEVLIKTSSGMAVAAYYPNAQDDQWEPGDAVSGMYGHGAYINGKVLGWQFLPE